MRHAIGPVTAALAAALLTAACAGAPTPLPEAESEDARLYARVCGACHSVPHPKRHTVAEWEPMMALMDQRMAEKGMTVPESDRARITAFLARHAKGVK